MQFPGSHSKGFAHAVAASLFAIMCARSVLGQEWLLNPEDSIKGAVMPVYQKFGTEPVAVCRAERVFSDYQRRGFFRIGVLPLLVFDGLQIEVRDPARVSSILSSVSGRFASKGQIKKAVEGRDFTLRFASESSGRLRARRVRLERGTEWHLQDGTVDQLGGEAVSFSRATLTVTGANAGEVVCETTNGAVRFRLGSLAGRKGKGEG